MNLTTPHKRSSRIDVIFKNPWESARYIQGSVLTFNLSEHSMITDIHRVSISFNYKNYNTCIKPNYFVIDNLIGCAKVNPSRPVWGSHRDIFYQRAKLMSGVMRLVEEFKGSELQIIDRIVKVSKLFKIWLEILETFTAKLVLNYSLLTLCSLLGILVEVSTFQNCDLKLKFSTFDVELEDLF